ncbi:MAG: peptidoglycan DD-metalloendopeptidase family protein [Rhizobiales bacterium]|nr:peptidoglycan DD-metalloendopeptidase family protein [Hyphomicrobiales bacterium]
MVKFVTSSLRALALAGAVTGMSATQNLAQDADQSEEIGAIQRQIENSEARQSEIASEIEAIGREAESLSDRLVTIANGIQVRERAIISAEQRIAELNAEEGRISVDLAAKEDVLSELLAGLQRLERNPPPALVVEPGDILGALRGAMLLGTVVPELRQEATALADQLERLRSIRNATEIERQNIRDNLARLTAAQRELSTLQSRKKALMEAAGQRLDAEKSRAESLAAKARTLQQLAQSLAAERERQAQEAEAIEKKRLQEAALLKPRTPFGDNRGRLDYPSQGQILRKFGDEDGFGGKTKGIYIATREGAQVVTPADAHVEFAGPFRSYGELLILDAGDGYHLLLAGLGKVSIGTGEFVRAGEPVGLMGAAAAPGTLMGDRVQESRPVLYIEFRKGGETVDSSPWWIGGLAQARG